MPYFGVNEEVKFMHDLSIQEGKMFIPIIVRAGFYEMFDIISQNTAYPQENGNYKPLEKWKNRSEAWAQISKRLLEIKKNLNL